MSETDAPLSRAKAKALRLLASRPRTSSQIRDRLERDGMAESASDVIAWLTKLGYLDDDAFARARARYLLGPGRLGPRLAEHRLTAAGVAVPMARHAIEAALEDASDGLGERGGGERRSGSRAELALCAEALRRRLRGAAVESLDEKGKQRLARFLLGRGFSSGAVARVLGFVPDLG